MGSYLRRNAFELLLRLHSSVPIAVVNRFVLTYDTGSDC